MSAEDCSLPPCPIQCPLLLLLLLLLFQFFISNFSSSPLILTKSMSVTTLMFRSLVRLVTTMVGQPISSVTTLLYYSDLLPQNVLLQRLVRHELLDQENYFFHFLINFLRCFW